MSTIEAPVTDVFTENDITEWMSEYLAKLLDVSVDEIDVDADFRSMGLDSSSTVGISGDLSNSFGVELGESLLYDYPTIKDVASHVVTLQ
ncbi:MAG: acyl carrier protein [Pseudomonadota bacterium]